MSASPLGRAELVRRIDGRLARVIGKDLPILAKIRRFVVKSGGKRIRPLTHYYMAGVLGYAGDEWADVGAIGELIHAASLLHDDVVDESAMRRGRPSINAQHGNKTAVLAGDFLLACGLDHLRTLSRAQQLLGLFTRVLRFLAVGELLQMRYERSFDLSEKLYDRIILGKTGVLFGAMTEGAAVLAAPAGMAGVEAGNQFARYRDFGERMGRLFQVRDDYLDYFGDVDSNGKALYQDFARGLMTRPSIVLRKKAALRERRELGRIWRSADLRNDPRSLERVLEIGTRLRVREKLATEIEEEVHALLRFVRSHPESLFREKILESLKTLLV